MATEQRIYRKPIERERDLVEIARLYLRGKTQQEIADYLAEAHGYQLSKFSICRDLKEVRERWMAASIRDMDEAKAQELAKLDQLEATHWGAWENSVAASNPDPRYLDGVLKCLTLRARVLGIEAPQRVGIGQDPEAGPIEVRNISGEIVSRIAGIVARASEAEGPQPDPEPEQH